MMISLSEALGVSGNYTPFWWVNSHEEELGIITTKRATPSLLPDGEIGEAPLLLSPCFRALEDIYRWVGGGLYFLPSLHAGY